MDIVSILSKLGLPENLTQDIMLALFVVFVSFVYGMVIGRHRMMTALINTYVSLALVNAIPKKMFTDYDSKVLVFFILLVGLTIFSKRFFDLTLSGSGSGFLWRVFSMSFLQIALILSIVLSIIPKTVALGYVSGDALDYLVSGWAPFIWMAAPLVYMFFIYKRINH